MSIFDIGRNNALQAFAPPGHAMQINFDVMCTERSSRMELLDLGGCLIDAAVDGRCNGQSTSYYSKYASNKREEASCTLLFVDHFHWADVLSTIVS